MESINVLFLLPPVSQAEDLSSARLRWCVVSAGLEMLPWMAMRTLRAKLSRTIMAGVKVSSSSGCSPC